MVYLLGKHYNRALRVHRTVLEAAERLLLRLFESNGGHIPDEVQVCIKQLANAPSSHKLQQVLANTCFQQWYKNYINFRQSVRDGNKGLTQQFWMKYIDIAWAINGLSKSVKTNDIKLRIFCLDTDINPLFFSQNHQNYARYMSYHTYQLINLESSNPGAMDYIEENGFTVNRSDVPSSRNAVDQTIEQTLNKEGKGTGGFRTFSLNPAAVQRWAITRPVRAEYKSGLYRMVDLIKTNQKIHKDCQNSEIKKSEADVLAVMNAFETHFLNPFDIEVKDKLVCVSSGSHVSHDVAQDILSIDAVGRAAYHSFVEDRLINRTVKFHDPIKRIKLKTFSDNSTYTTVKSRKDGSNVKLRASRNVFMQLTILASQQNFSLRVLLTYPLSPIPWSLATADGMPTTTDKSQLMHLLEKDCVVQKSITDSVTIVDGMAILRQQKSRPRTFGELALQVFQQLPLGRCKRVDFITDTYREGSIKGLVHIKRGCNTSKEYLIGGPSTTIPQEYQTFLANSKNKQQCIDIFFIEWKSDKYAKYLHGKVLYFVKEETVFMLTSDDGKTTSCSEVDRLHSTHDEADSRIILHSIDIGEIEEPGTNVIVRCSDTDVFVLLIHFYPEIGTNVFFDTGTGDKRRLIDISLVFNKLGHQAAKAILGFHAFTGCDSVSSFTRKGKIRPWQIMLKDCEIMDAYGQLGLWDDLSPNIANIIEGHVCQMYGSKQQIKDINQVRYTKFLESYSPKSSLIDCDVGKDVSLLPPCQSELIEQLKRANYQSRMWAQSNCQVPILQNPILHGFRKEDNIMVPNWFEGPIVPDGMLDIIDNSIEEPDCVSDVEPENSFLDFIYSDDE